ncbi:enolase C-terminal domain-like protein [Paracoccus sp. SCSIO 75233]|uniref:enolase C-terminal domain-like protein n=1 Tax=Paracoccus sp. SCSIO 75233 TaxID=3017782 RepID=UPI0022F07CCD|nr:enolase C-terminal domain-like protein [Paracoccus sp. SCSIO 75233]WBU51863.1 mandelate racemase [Paracoccus sp. SCSIO 75233]
MSDPISLSVLDVQISERPVTMRLPFQFGSTEVRETAEAYCTLRAVIGGREVSGYAAQLMVPRWFDKRPELSNADTIDELRHTVASAARLITGQSGSVAELSVGLRQAVIDDLPADVPALAAGFGPALIEMALIDAVCRSVAQPFWLAARQDLFGLGQILPADLTPEAYDAALNAIEKPHSITLRHTVGFDAPLVETPPDAPQDGLPVTVSDVIITTGITSWKIKLKGDPEADAARLLALQPVLSGHMDGGVTLDANEQYTPDAFRDLLNRLRAPGLAELTGKIRFFEQPFARDVALATRADFGARLVIDESDDGMDSFADALRLGWGGTSIKSCKGVLRALVNMARARQAGALLSGEDLTCQPGLCWTQDTAMASACGVADVERNGHHFAGGMQGATEAERARMLKLHPGIFRGDAKRVTLAVKAGAVNISSLAAPGFGASNAMAEMQNDEGN